MMPTLALLVAMTTGVKQPPVTTFSCIRSGENFATIARRGSRVTPPMIIWRTDLGLWSAWERCRVVSQRLTEAVASQGGSFRNLFLTYGSVNQQSVICYVNSTEGACNNKNLLFTLKPSDRGREQAILEQLVSFGVRGSGTAVVQSAPQFYAPLGEAVENQLSGR
ncbi:MAG: COP23 domain-containing protein [Pseudanabaenaceae cyanobacterium SKYGB_i_bin29]|nr:COP23 domain-containing protein [Pseudanabaenaceae cyanobacterium SKYG29]MDW8421046.1 COP23 domain-containing protein [Pseudanabaenaceae cyanobacterium SKYGB_i_bin29]